MLGWICTYTPVEIISAMGLDYYRLYGKELVQDKINTDYLPANFCPFVKLCFKETLNSNLTGIILTASCHGLVHLYNSITCWSRLQKKDFFAFLLDLPRTGQQTRECAIRVLSSTYHHLTESLSKFYGVEWNYDAFYKAVQKQNEVRSLLREIYSLQRTCPEEIRAAGVFEVVRLASRARSEEIYPVLLNILNSLQGENVSSVSKDDDLFKKLKRQNPSKGPRVLLAGSPLPSEFLDLIEELGGNIVGDDLCQGYRSCLTEIEVDEDPFGDLARGYLDRVPCPRMLVGRKRLGYLKSLVEETKAQGIIYHTLKFCDASLYEHSLLNQLVREIPVLYLETEFRTGNREQVRTRIQAFLEIL